MDMRGAWALCEAIRIAAIPRHADVWDEGGRVWRRVKVGAVDMVAQADSPARIVGTIELFEEV